MNKELTNKLLKRFPIMYREYYYMADRTCMCWGFDCGDGWFDILWQLSLAVEDELGYSFFKKKRLATQILLNRTWNKSLLKTLQFFLSSEYNEKRTEKEKKKVEEKYALMRRIYYNLSLEDPALFAVSQVKEKYGTLRFYTNYANDRIYKFEGWACHLSGRICESCGEGGSMRGRGWYYVSCKKCCKDPSEYTREEMKEFKKNETVEYIKWLDGLNSEDRKYFEEEYLKEQEEESDDE